MGDAIRSKRWKMILTIVTIVAMVGLAYALRDQIYQAYENIQRVNVWFLLLLIPLQGLNYHAQARLYQAMLRILKQKIDYWNMYRIALELNFVNNVFPSGGVSGFSYFSLRMKPKGISTAQSTLVQMLRHALVFISFQILLFIGLLLLAIDGRANGLMILVAGSLATLLLIGTLFAVYIVGSKSRINAFFTALTKFLNRIIHTVRPKNPETISIVRAQKAFTELHENYLIIKKDYSVIRRPLLYSLLANATEVATIYAVYLAFGQVVNPGAVIIAYAVANFAGLISVLPGGVGIYEALMTAVLAAGGVPAAVSLPVTVMYRILNMAIQLPPGFFFYQRTLHKSTN